MLLDGRPLWVAQTNCYVLAAERGAMAVVIDTPPDLEGLADLLVLHDLTPVALILTHAHVDHAGGARAAADRYDVSAYLHPDDEWLALDPLSQIRSLFGSGMALEIAEEFAPPDHFEPLADDEKLSLAGIDIEVLHTPGHTPGHVCFHVPAEGMLFSGDQLFAGSIGRTDLPGGDHEALMRSMAEKVIPLDEGTDVLPGHGPATTLARELRTNPWLQKL